MNPRGPVPQKTAIFLLLALCLPGWNNLLALSANFGHESSTASDEPPILAHAIAAAYHRQTFGSALALSDFDGDQPDCEKQVFAFEDLKPELKRFVTMAVLPDLRRTDHSPPGPRSPPDYHTL